MKIPKIDKRAHLSTSYPGTIAGYTVVDIMFSRLSIFSKLNGWGIWPSRETLAGMVMRKGWPLPKQIAHWRRYMVKGAAVYRLYVIEEIGGSDGS